MMFIHQILSLCFNVRQFYEISKTYFDQTALHIAIEKGNIDIVKLLLSSKDIDISIKLILIKIFISF